MEKEIINNLAYTKKQLNNKNGIYSENEVVYEKTKPYKSCYYHLVYIAHEFGIFSQGNENVDASPGDVFLINPNITYTFSAPTERGAMSVYSCAFFEDKFPFDINRIKEVFPSMNDFFDRKTAYIKVKDTPHKDIRAYIVRMIDNTRHHRQGFEFIEKPFLSLALIAIFRIHNNVIPSDVKTTNHIAGIVLNYLQKHLHEQISTHWLANKYHVSDGYLCRNFKQHMGKTIIEYVNYLRVEKIKDELKNTERPIQMIYDYFNLSNHYLLRVFKKSTGMTLLQYREKYNYKSNNSIYDNKE